MSQARGVTVPGPDGFADPAEVQEKGVHKSSLCHAPSCTIELGRAIGREQVLMPWGTIVSFGVGFRQPR